MKILLIGGYGLLGSAIYNVFAYNNYEIIRYKKEELDLLSRELLETSLIYDKPQLIINASGYTDVAGAETEWEKALKLNVIAVYNLIYSAKKLEIPIVHFSTDYVFNGLACSPYKEEDIAIPINKYGWTKKIGEDIIRANYEKHYIIRTSWLYGMEGRCFPKVILDKLSKGERLKVVDDQFGTPTYTVDLAKSLLCLHNVPYGTYHITNGGSTNWFEYAKLIAQYMGIDCSNICNVKTQEMGFSVQRPLYSVLDNQKWNKINPPLRHYKEALYDFLEEVKNNKSGVE